MSKTFLKTDGDIRAVLRNHVSLAGVLGARGLSRARKDAIRIRGLIAARDAGRRYRPAAVAGHAEQDGRAAVWMQPPTGYSTKSDVWVNSAALLDRMNFGLSPGDQQAAELARHNCESISLPLFGRDEARAGWCRSIPNAVEAGANAGGRRHFQADARHHRGADRHPSPPNGLQSPNVNVSRIAAGLAGIPKEVASACQSAGLVIDSEAQPEFAVAYRLKLIANH